MKKVIALLPEGKLFDRLYSEAIVPAVEKANWSVERLSLECSSQSKFATVHRALENADIVIADLTGKNPNVMYLVGYAHGIGRKMLLIAQHLEDFPLDKMHSVIGYAGDRAFLTTELEAFLATGTVSAKEKTSDSGGSANEKFVSLFGDILSAHNYEHRGEIQMENPTTFVLLNQDMDLALVQALARRARELGLRLKLM